MPFIRDLYFYLLFLISLALSLRHGSAMHNGRYHFISFYLVLWDWEW